MKEIISPEGELKNRIALVTNPMSIQEIVGGIDVHILGSCGLFDACFDAFVVGLICLMLVWFVV